VAVCETLRCIKLIEDRENERFTWNVALKAVGGDVDKAEEVVRAVMMEVQSEREHAGLYK
jgi:hypothetical protein